MSSELSEIKVIDVPTNKNGSIGEASHCSRLTIPMEAIDDTWGTALTMANANRWHSPMLK